MVFVTRRVPRKANVMRAMKALIDLSCCFKKKPPFMRSCVRKPVASYVRKDGSANAWLWKGTKPSLLCAPVV